MGVQTIEEKAEAIATVLPLIHVHHPEVKSCISYPREPKPAPRRPPSEEDEELFFRKRRYYEKAFRTREIEAALDVLSEHEPLWATSVYYEFVEPWPEFAPNTRRKHAEAGLRFIATYLPGDVPFFSLDPIHEPWRFQVRRMRREGLSIREIARKLGRGTATIQAAVRGVKLVAGKLRLG